METTMYPSDRRYTKEHEWVIVQGSRGRVGITDYAQKQLGDVVFVELPEAVVEVNTAVGAKPEMINTDPHGAWLVAVELSNPGEVDSLLTSDQYTELVK
jgi:glycine cleavage system H protein